MTETEQAQRNRDLVRALYEASFAGDANAFSDAMLEDFEADVPPVLPWGGVQRGPEAFLTDVLRPHPHDCEGLAYHTDAAHRPLRRKGVAKTNLDWHVCAHKG